ncbi:MAG: hypothetical protein EBU68_02535 [Actinobacteria bacterium]|nr:hypothetical protein [Actinomycetota bacterium]
MGVSIAYCTHVVIAVLFGSALSKLPERPIHLLVGLVFLVAGVVMFRSSNLERQETQEIHQTRNFFKVVYLSMSAILVAEFADLTQLATVGFTVRMNDSVGVAIGAASALCSVSAIAVLAALATLTTPTQRERQLQHACNTRCLHPPKQQMVDACELQA